jgi:hypothetical protein
MTTQYFDMKYVLSIAAVMAVAPAVAGEGDYQCGDVLISVRPQDSAKKGKLMFGFEMHVLKRDSDSWDTRRPISIPGFMFVPATRKMTMNGKTCQEGE